MWAVLPQTASSVPASPYRSVQAQRDTSSASPSSRSAPEKTYNSMKSPFLRVYTENSGLKKRSTRRLSAPSSAPQSTSELPGGSSGNALSGSS